MCIKCKIMGNIVEITYKGKLYRIQKKKLNQVFAFLAEIKYSDKELPPDYDRNIEEKLKEFSLVDEYFLENINKL